jgi:prepilin-type N-terminal cleavage/methylation domain-containing protein
MSHTTNKQRGYTLVEIAIVLVIIGLLLGGVLKGQELINSAQVRNLADQSSSIQAAYYGFVDRYRQIPGDMVGTQVCDVIGSHVPGCPGSGVSEVSPPGGNGNGWIDPGNWNEASAVWAHLSASGFIQGNYKGGATDETTYRNPPIAPVNAFGGPLLLSRTHDYHPVGQGSRKLNLVLGHRIPVKIIREFDVKKDEGLPTTGTVRATVSGGAAFGGIAQGDPDCIDLEASPQIWNISGDSSDCNAVFLY